MINHEEPNLGAVNLERFDGCDHWQFVYYACTVSRSSPGGRHRVQFNSPSGHGNYEVTEFTVYFDDSTVTTTISVVLANMHDLNDYVLVFHGDGSLWSKFPNGVDPEVPPEVKDYISRYRGL